MFTEPFRPAEETLDYALRPDLIVRCGPLSPGAASLILVEVMSDGSIGRDQVEKWRVSQKLPSLEHYALVERDKPVIEMFDRAGEAWFKQRLIEGLDATLDQAALDLAIPLAEISRDLLSA